MTDEELRRIAKSGLPPKGYPCQVCGAANDDTWVVGTVDLTDKNGVIDLTFEGCPECGAFRLQLPRTPVEPEAPGVPGACVQCGEPGGEGWRRFLIRDRDRGRGRDATVEACPSCQTVRLARP